MTSFDLVLHGGLVVDGTVAAGRVADVGVLGDRVLAVGDLSDVDPTATVASVIDVAGRVVSPGFIDPHGHSDGAGTPPERNRTRGGQRPSGGPRRSGDGGACRTPLAASRVIRRVGPAAAIAATEMPAIATLPGGPVPYTLRHSPQAHGLRVVIHPDRGVIVTVPATRDGRRHEEHHATAFLAQREAWLRRHLVRQEREAATIADRGGARHGGRIPYLGELHSVAVVPAVSGTTRSHVVHLPDTRELILHRTPRERRADPAIAEAWLRDRARAAIEAAIQVHAEGLHVTPAAVTLRDPRTRWGSASRRGCLSFSWRLILAPPPALETVVIHELAHLRVFGHGPRFWSIVVARRPDHRTWRRWLHDHAAELHRALG